MSEQNSPLDNEIGGLRSENDQLLSSSTARIVNQLYLDPAESGRVYRQMSSGEHLGLSGSLVSAMKIEYQSEDDLQLWQQVKACVNSKDYRQGERILADSLDKQMPGLSLDQKVQRQYEIGRFCEQYELYDSAKKWYEKTANTAVECFGKHNFITALNYRNMAQVDIRQGQWDSAAINNAKALNICETELKAHAEKNEDLFMDRGAAASTVNILRQSAQILGHLKDGSAQTKQLRREKAREQVQRANGIEQKYLSRKPREHITSA